MSESLKQLGETIRQQRLSLQPQDVGLPAAGRRRGGLSQQEVAVLSGVSTRWLARLEQGQFKAADTELFRRVLNILCFSTQEQERLLRQAGWQPEYWSEVSQQQLQNHLQKLLDGMDYPAYVVDHLWNRVRWNKPAARLFTHWLGKQVQYTNFIDYLLLDPHSRLFILHWEKHVVLWLGRLFIKIQPYLDNESVAQFVAERCGKSPVFERLYHKRRQQRGHKLGMRYVFRTGKGERAFNRMAFPVQGSAGWQLIVWLPVPVKKAPAAEEVVVAHAADAAVSVAAHESAVDRIKAV